MKSFVLPLETDSQRFQVKEAVITFAIRKKLHETTIPHIILRVRTFKDLVGIVVNVINGTLCGKTRNTGCPLLMREISKRAKSFTTPLSGSRRAYPSTFVLLFLCGLDLQYQGLLPSPQMNSACWAGQVRYILWRSRHVVSHLMPL